MNLKQLFGAIALTAMSLTASATPELLLNYSKDDAATTHVEIGNGTYHGWFIWADTDYSTVYVATSDDDGDNSGDIFTTLLNVSSGVDGAFSITLDGGTVPIIDFLGVNVSVVEDTFDWVDAFAITFDPEVPIGQDLIFTLAATDSQVDSADDFGMDVINGDVVSSKLINVWDASVNDWISGFDVEYTSLLGDSAQRFDLTRVPEPSTIVFLGLSLAGLAASRRFAKK